MGAAKVAKHAEHWLDGRQEYAPTPGTVEIRAITQTMKSEHCTKSKNQVEHVRSFAVL